MGRPMTYGDRMRTGLRLPLPLAEALDALAAERGVSRNKLIEQACYGLVYSPDYERAVNDGRETR